MQHGFYDLLLTKALEKQCSELDGVQISEESMGKEEFWHEFPSLVATEILNYLKLHDDHLQGKNIYSSLKRLFDSCDFIEYLKQRIIPTSGKKLLSFLPAYAANNRPVMFSNRNLPSSWRAAGERNSGAPSGVQEHRQG